MGGALAAVLFVAVFLPVGLALFLGEWLFGSIGWGVLHGTLASLALAVVLVLLALDVRRDFLARSFGLALLVGLAVAVVFGFAWSNLAWTRLGEAIAGGIDPANRPLVVAVVASAVIGGVIGLAAAARLSGSGAGAGAAVAGLFAGAIAGVLVGAFSAISFRPRVGIAIGIAVALVAWPSLSLTALRGFDPDSLKRRFWPTATIETTQETIGWLDQIREGTRRGWRS